MSRERTLLGDIFISFYGTHITATIIDVSFSLSVSDADTMLLSLADQYLKIKMVNFGKKLMADQIPEWKGYCSHLYKILLILYSEPIYITIKLWVL
jgi:hypothetical protein